MNTSTRLATLIAVVCAIGSVLAFPLRGRTAPQDPFATTQRMHDKALAIERARQEAARRELEAKEVEEGGFRPAATSVFRLPQMQLKGFALDSDGEPFALLEVTGSGTFVVRGEDTLSVQHTQGNLVLKVERIENRTVFVEVGTLGQTIVVR